MTYQRISLCIWFAMILSCLSLAAAPLGAQAPAKITVDWDKVLRMSKTAATLQVVVNPLLRRGSPIHDQVLQNLRDLKCDYVRYVPWLPYPRLGVAELEPPRDGKTSWDFSLIDPLTVDFLNAAGNHPVILNFSTIPQWMFKIEKPVSYPVDADQVTWSYEQGTELRDPSAKEVADYYARLVSWYTAGGFTDEYGKRHESGHHFKIAYWEVLNEVDFEHQMSPESYTKLYDAVVEAIRRVEPQMKFVGMALAAPSVNPQFFEYFLNPKNHEPGIPLDMISYHFYAQPDEDEQPAAWSYTFFEQANHFLDVVRYIESIRQRLAPKTQTTIDELGAILPSDNVMPYHPIPDSYWNLCAVLYAYLYARLSELGIDVAGESQLVGYPTQFPSVSMVDWNTGKPNARYSVLKLMHNHFGPEDKLVATHTDLPSVYAQAFVTRSGARKVLLINKRDHLTTVSLPGGVGGQAEYVDQTTEFDPGHLRLPGDEINLNGYAVVVVTLAYGQ